VQIQVPIISIIVVSRSQGEGCAADPDFWDEFPEAIRELDAAGEARVLVLSSSGKHFCSKMDLTEFTSGGSATSGATRAHGRGASRNHILELQETFSCLERARMPA